MRVRRSLQPSAIGEKRSTLRVRNPDSGVLYHLVFDGSLRRLTGAQLRRHLESICLVPGEQLRLTFNGVPVEDASTGAALGLHDKALLEMRVAVEEGRMPPSQRLAGSRWNDNKQHPNNTDEHLNHSGTPSATQQTSPPQLREEQHHQQQEQQRQHQRWHIPNGRDGPHSGVQEHATASLALNSRRARQEGDVTIEEDAIEDVDTAMMPLHYADIEDAQLEYKDYIWMMEQMRFETERMNRERELLRQRQELEYEAEILERERSIVGRRTLQERRRLLELQRWIREEMAMEARVLNIEGEDSVVEDKNTDALATQDCGDDPLVY
ncbi:hypothetical protein DQ04_06841040 [Trypanosoma grayi]|uniref:hypothetical protein n=1 Tax=Trypanosoma grayi TaxID=71804 RepID=UPI0004F4A4CF|nr:hypothetical protein DQ04_06841040 [Trypanosoma grayi]KEG08596.1 hypothetical protein DQ04_06841040 [Trypanosoma grayi]